MKDNTNDVLPLARIVARELSAEELLQVSGGYPSCNTCNGNSPDGTSGGARVTDADRLQ